MRRCTTLCEQSCDRCGRQVGVDAKLDGLNIFNRDAYNIEISSRFGYYYHKYEDKNPISIQSYDLCEYCRDEVLDIIREALKPK